jgi:ribosome-associated protein
MTGRPRPDVPIRDGSIRLGQFLKLADLIDTGSDAKAVIAAGEVTVNDAVELRRGRQLQPGDIVAIGDRSARVSRG